MLVGERGDCGLQVPFVIWPSAGLDGTGRRVASFPALVAPPLTEPAFSLWREAGCRAVILARELAVGAISVEEGRVLPVFPAGFEWELASVPFPLILVRLPIEEVPPVLSDALVLIPSEDIPTVEPFLL